MGRARDRPPPTGATDGWPAGSGDRPSGLHGWVERAPPGQRPLAAAPTPAPLRQAEQAELVKRTPRPALPPPSPPLLAGAGKASAGPRRFAAGRHDPAPWPDL